MAHEAWCEGLFRVSVAVPPYDSPLSLIFDLRVFLALKLPYPLLNSFSDAQQNFEKLSGAVGSGVVASLPAAPYDGQVVDYLADDANGVVWRLKYRAASASVYKWEFVGGPPLFAEVTTATTIPSNQTVYGNLTSGSGPDVTVPLAGDFMVEQGVDATAPNGTSVHAYMSYAIGATAAVDADAVLWANLSAASPQATFNASRKRRKTGLAAAVTLASKYRVDAAVAVNVQDRWMSVLPVRCG